MLSSVSKLVDKTFVLGFVLPALLCAVAALGVFGCPHWLGDACDAKTTNPFASLTYAALAVYAVAVLLLTINYSLYRILEGYVPPFSWFPSLRSWHVRRLHRIEDEIRRMDESDEDSSVKTWRLLSTYPSSENEVLPTAFGNAIRAFEMYPAEIYGADAIGVWPRLAAVIPKDFQGLVNDAKAQVDFFVNLCALMLALSAAILVRAVTDWWQVKLAERAVADPVSAAAAIPFLLLAVAAYAFAVSQIGNWGELVKSAFDCYLPALEKKLGYVVPPTEEGRHAFWQAFSVRALYRIGFNGKFQPAEADSPAGTIASASPRDQNGGDGDDDADEA